MLKIAWRNLWRNRTRTVIVVMAISLSYGLLLFSWGLGDAAHSKMELAALKMAGGSILVHGEGYWASQTADFVVTEPDRVLEALEGIDGVERGIRRVIINGLLSSPRGASAVRLTGVSPDDEAQLTNLAPFIVEGTFLGAETDDPLVIGRGVATDLELELGDRVVLTATDPDGAVVTALFHLSGIFHTGAAGFDDFLAYTTVAVAQQAVGMVGSVTQVGVVIRDDDDRYEVRAALLASLGGYAEGLEVITWDEAVPEMVGYIEVDDSFNYLYAVIIFIVVGFGIMNTFLMSVVERIRELGLLSALGLTPSRMLRLLFTEACLLGALSVAIGFSLGFAIHLYFANHGLDLAKLYDIDLEIAGVSMVDTLIRSELRPAKWAGAAAGVFGLVMFSCLYPAWRAIRLDPAAAMRTYQ
jgi:ABC-type lipoprotein release transport system permease subunit